MDVNYTEFTRQPKISPNGHYPLNLGSNQHPTPFQWKFDCAKLIALFAKIEARQQAHTATPFACFKETA